MEWVTRTKYAFIRDRAEQKLILLHLDGWMDREWFKRVIKSLNSLTYEIYPEVVKRAEESNTGLVDTLIRLAEEENGIF